MFLSKKLVQLMLCALVVSQSSIFSMMRRTLRPVAPTVSQNILPNMMAASKFAKYFGEVPPYDFLNLKEGGNPFTYFGSNLDDPRLINHVPKGTSLVSYGIADYLLLVPFKDYSDQLLSVDRQSDSKWEYWDRIRQSYQVKFASHCDMILAMMKHFHVAQYLQIKNILMSHIDNEKERKVRETLIREYEAFWPEYLENYRRLDFYYKIAWYMNIMLNLTYHQNLTCFIVKDIIKSNPEKTYNLISLGFDKIPEDYTVATYTPKSKRINFCHVFVQTLCPALQLWSVFHEVQHATQLFLDNTVENVAKLEEDAERSAAESMHCEVCLKINQIYYAPMKRPAGYFKYKDFEPYIKRAQEKKLLCKAHAECSELTQEIKNLAEIATRLFEAESYGPNELNILRKMQELDCKTGNIFDHYARK